MSIRGVRHRDNQWFFDLQNTTMDRSKERASVPPENSSLLYGIDALVAGAPRLATGFIKVHTLGVPSTDHDADSQVSEISSFNIKTEDGFAWGYVYLYERSTDNNQDLVIDYWSYNSSTGSISTSVGNVLKTDIPLDRRMTVTTWGLLCIIHIEKRDPLAFYLESGAIKTLDPPGPGKQPTLLFPYQMDVLGSLVIPTDGAPAQGGVYLGLATPSTSGLGLTQSDADITTLDKGSYTFAFVLQDTRTGNWSHITEIADARISDFRLEASSASSGGTSTILYNSLNCAFEIVYDSSKFDTCHIYRSVRVEGAGGTYVAGILHLEKILTLADYHTNKNSSSPFSGTSWRHAVYFLELDDKALVFRPTYIDRPMYDETVPQAGSGVIYDNVLILGDVTGTNPSTTKENRPEDILRGQGEIRWSSTSMSAPLLFPPQNRYLTKPLGIPVHDLHLVGPNVVAISKESAYLLRRESTYMDVFPIYEGFGSIHAGASTVVGPNVYTLTNKGLRIIGPEASVDFVHILDHHLLNTWGQDLAQPYKKRTLSIAFDSQASILFLQNSRLEETLCLWMNTGKVSGFLDTPFDRVFQGFVPSSQSNSGNPELTRRALFLQNPPSYFKEYGGSTSQFKPTIYAFDSGRTKYHSSGGTFYYKSTTLDLIGSTPIQSPTSVTTGITSGGLRYHDLVLPSGIPAGTIGSYVYIIRSDDPKKLGHKARVVATPGGSTLRVAYFSKYFFDEDENGPYGGTEVVPTTSDTIAISPLPFLWNGPVLRDPSATFNIYPVKKVESLTPIFTDVILSPTNTDKVLMAATLYKGEDPQPFAYSYPRDTSGSILSTVIKEDDPSVTAHYGSSFTTTSTPLGRISTIVSAGLIIIAPEADFRLLSTTVRGGILSTTDQTVPKP